MWRAVTGDADRMQRIGRGAFLLSAVTLALLASRVALAASEPAELLMMRGVAELHRGMTEEAAGRHLLAEPHYREALALLTRAQAADPLEETHALYFKGVTEGRLEQWDAAVDDLKRALEKKPELNQARLEIGVALAKRGGRDDEAATWLRQAQQTPEFDAAASFYLGIVQLRRKELSDARESLARAQRIAPTLAPVCRYYEALVEVQAEERERATTLLEAVVGEAASGSGIRREATKILIGLRRGEWPTSRRYQVYASAGLEYDSNVLLAPLDQPVPINGEIAAQFGKQADGRAVIAAGGSVSLWRGTDAQVGASYDFLQSLHFDLTEFNVQSHRPSLFANWRHGIVSAGLLGAYDYYLRDLNSFLQEAEAFPWVSVEEGDWGRSECFYRFRWRDFKDATLHRVLDSLTHTVGLDQYVYLTSPDHYLVAGYRYDNLDAAAGATDNFMYDANQVWGGVGWAWPLAIATELDFAYRFKNYDPASKGRDDNEYRLVASAQMPVTRLVSTTLAYFGTFNDSNQRAFTYNRHIVSLSVGVRF